MADLHVRRIGKDSFSKTVKAFKCCVFGKVSGVNARDEKVVRNIGNQWGMGENVGVMLIMAFPLDVFLVDRSSA
jgi:hypothetical protein